MCIVTRTPESPTLALNKFWCFGRLRWKSCPLNINLLWNGVQPCYFVIDYARGPWHSANYGPPQGGSPRTYPLFTHCHVFEGVVERKTLDRVSTIGCVPWLWAICHYVWSPIVIHIRIVHCVKHPLLPRQLWAKALQHIKGFSHIIINLNLTQSTSIIHNLGPLRTIWHQRIMRCFRAVLSKFEFWLPQFNSSSLNELGGEGGSLPLIFCVHVRSGSIYWGGIYLAGKDYKVMVFYM